MKPKTIESWREMPLTLFDDVKNIKPNTYLKTSGYILGPVDEQTGSYDPSHHAKAFKDIFGNIILSLYQASVDGLFSYGAVKENLSGIYHVFFCEFKHSVSFHIFEEKHDSKHPTPSKENNIEYEDGGSVTFRELQFGLQPTFSRYKKGNLPELGHDLDKITTQGSLVTVGGLYKPVGGFPFFNMKYVSSGGIEKTLN